MDKKTLSLFCLMLLSSMVETPVFFLGALVSEYRKLKKKHEKGGMEELCTDLQLLRVHILLLRRLPRLPASVNSS